MACSRRQGLQQNWLKENSATYNKDAPVCPYVQLRSRMKSKITSKTAGSRNRTHVRRRRLAPAARPRRARPAVAHLDGLMVGDHGVGGTVQQEHRRILLVIPHLQVGTHISRTLTDLALMPVSWVAPTTPRTGRNNTAGMDWSHRRMRRQLQACQWAGSS